MLHGTDAIRWHKCFIVRHTVCKNWNQVMQLRTESDSLCMTKMRQSFSMHGGLSRKYFKWMCFFMPWHKHSNNNKSIRDTQKLNRIQSTSHMRSIRYYHQKAKKNNALLISILLAFNWNVFNIITPFALAIFPFIPRCLRLYRFLVYYYLLSMASVSFALKDNFNCIHVIAIDREWKFAAKRKIQK